MTADIPPIGNPLTSSVSNAFRRVYSVIVGAVMPTVCGSGNTSASESLSISIRLSM